MKDLYGKRQPESTAGTSRLRQSTSARALHNDAIFAVADSQQTIKPVTKKWRPSQRSVCPKTKPLSATGQKDLLPVQCVRCGDAFPKADFEYTKKSGMCISCWEIKIKVA
jgi:formylmethanofuran dehydrogenase subunit E